VALNRKRPDRIEYYLGIAREVARRGTCLRRNFGAIIVQHDQIISTGYTGAPRGTVNCIDVGECYRDKMNIPSGQRYELCRSVHAEMNAIIHAARTEMLEATMYLVGLEAATGDYVEFTEPCKLCKRAVINAGIKEVYVRRGPDNIERILVEDWVKNEEAEFYGADKKY
jgi:dCMP deaminase